MGNTEGASKPLPQSPAPLWLTCAPLPIGIGLVHGLGVHAEAQTHYALQMLPRQKSWLPQG